MLEDFTSCEFWEDFKGFQRCFNEFKVFSTGFRGVLWHFRGFQLSFVGLHRLLGESYGSFSWIWWGFMNFTGYLVSFRGPKEDSRGVLSHFRGLPMRFEGFFSGGILWGFRKFQGVSEALSGISVASRTFRYISLKGVSRWF